ncbi:hypothetical protein [Alicyclobacillus macrosporangiidus]|uniref:hypothetical protein n=1 Tax=Alicyclobacillus macrosporangiidus TaxID=392015 RepID=UPI00054D9327|nr:hypothetical protein [Alicyclobacillus macrosporangiidus]
MSFKLDPRLGIELPDFERPYEEMDPREQEEILVQWERIRAKIPDQIVRFERVIEDLLQEVHKEEDWDVISAHFADIADYASRIHELNTWRRVDPALGSIPAQGHAQEHRDREKAT